VHADDVVEAVPVHREAGQAGGPGRLKRTDLERAERAGERGAGAALKAVRTLTLQLSGAQLGITVTGPVIGMLAEGSVGKLLTGPLEAVGLSRSAASSTALVLATALSTVILMVVGELVPKNWAISRPLAVARTVAAPQCAFTSAFGPLIRHLNNTANRILRRLGMQPAEELASAGSPEELVALARHFVRAGALEADTVDSSEASDRVSTAAPVGGVTRLGEAAEPARYASHRQPGSVQDL
jgi:CBS domain containing-hemolysin-like protein